MKIKTHTHTPIINPFIHPKHIFPGQIGLDIAADCFLSNEYEQNPHYAYFDPHH